MRKAGNLALSLAIGISLCLPMTGTAYGDAGGSAEISKTGASTGAADTNKIGITDLKTEYMNNPLGIDVMKPRMSWKLRSDSRAQNQTAYRIQVASSSENLSANNPDMWDTNKVESSQSANIAYNGKPLESGKRYYWRVQVWDKSDTAPSEWSSPSWWEMGLLNEADWQAKWIGMSDTNNFTPEGLKWIWYPEGNPAQGAPAGNRYFRKTVQLPGDRTLTSGQFLITADDGFVLYVNGKRMGGSSETADSWKEGQIIDVSSALVAGANTIAIQTKNTSSAAGLLGSLKVGFTEGSPLQINMDQGMKAEKEKKDGWENPQFDDSKWAAAISIASYGQAPWGKNVKFSSSPPHIRKSFSLDKPVAKARLYSSALGIYEPSINGKRVGQDLFAPGWTDYTKHIQYQSYDVKELLKSGDNAIGAIVADGWYSGHVGFIGPNIYGDRNYLLMQLNIEYTDGSSVTIGTDGSWKWANGPIDSASILMGETYDARKELTDWDTPQYDATSWSPVQILEGKVAGKLIAQDGPTVQKIQEIKPIAITEPAPGKYVFDLGQNMVGAVRLKVKGEAGQVVTLRHAEVLNPDGSFYTANLRGAKATDQYTLKGGGDEVYEPRFTFHGFRYVEVTGYPGVPTKDAITGLVMHTAAPFSGKFETSNGMVNQLQSNITWGQRGNFLEVPTDTPARDERLGWTGDINVFIGAAAYNMDVAKFIGSKWMRDMRDGQSASGGFPDVAPNVLTSNGNAGWGDAGVTVPYTIWQRYGDTRVIEENYDAMVKWIEYLKKNSTGLIRPSSSYGDWLDVNDPTPGDLISTAYFAYSTRLVSEMAQAIGRQDDADKYAQLAGQIKDAFAKTYVSADGRVRGNTQTGYVLALHMDLIPEAKRQATADYLVAKIKERNWHLSTGFLGTRDLLAVLSETGYLDVAYRLLNNDTYPSWGYQIKKGATTMWERWDAIRPDGSFQDAGMNSFNHYAYGAVGDWMYQNIAGIQPDPANPGYKHIIIKPLPGGDLTSANGSYESVYGTIVSKWEKEGSVYKQNVTVPVNTTATLYIPADSKWAVTEGSGFAHSAQGVQFVGMEDGNAVFTVGSGDYQFTVDPIIGKLGNALDESNKLNVEAASLLSGGKLTQTQAEVIADKNTELANRIQASVEAYNSAQNGSFIEQVHHALNATAQLQGWVQEQQDAGQMSGETAHILAQFAANISMHLSAISTDELGINWSITPSKETVRPGETITIDIKTSNNGTETVNDVRSALLQPDGWEITPVGDDGIAAIKPGETFTASFKVKVAPNQPISESIRLTGSGSYKINDATVEVPLQTSLKVASLVTIKQIKAEPGAIEPGGAATVSATLQNSGGSAVEGLVELSVPAGWKTEAASQAYLLEAGEEKSVIFRVESPNNASETAAELKAIVSYNGAEADRASTTVQVRYTNPPASFIDHVDVGNTQSEQAHNVKFSAKSGANVEEGLTRRYVYRGDANGYFEFDMAIEPGQPFMIRAIETYDMAQLKDYYVLVNGKKVHSRANETSGRGTATYQFVVDDAALLQADKVIVRFQEDEEGRNYDPSIADIWTMPFKQDEVIPVTEIVWDRSSMELEDGESAEVSATVLPDNATNKKVRFESESAAIVVTNVRYDEASKATKATVKGTNKGKEPIQGVITAVTEDGSKTASLNVVVKAAAEQGEAVAILSGSEKVLAGQDAEWTVSAEHVSSTFTALDVVFHYDPQKFEFGTVQDSEGGTSVLDPAAIQSLKPNLAVLGSAIKAERGQIRIIMAVTGDSKEGINGGPLFSLHGKVKIGAAAGSATASLSDFTISNNGTAIDLDVSRATHTMEVGLADKTALIAAIKQAQAVHDAATEGSSPGQYPVGSKAALQTAIGNAAAVRDAANATSEQVAAALNTLNAAVKGFSDSVIPTIPVDRTALDAAIAAAQAKHDKAVEGSKIGKYAAGSKTVLQAAINAAKGAGGSQAQVDEAVKVLNEAVKAFSVKLVTLIAGQTKVTIRDLSVMAKYYGATSQSPNWSEIEKADVLGAGAIDIRALAAVAQMILDDWRVE
ncbi:NPCBM-associated, NEW3 domain of alpha-galactosidase [Paenibacillaceae bacterium GAS479]|nr:NPCBM-associated, NEW3 domain of alpha-galactosidase [Paenibacillaceae bacterium GAS479]